jgi:hypothetical protein
LIRASPGEPRRRGCRDPRAGGSNQLLPILSQRPPRSRRSHPYHCCDEQVTPRCSTLTVAGTVAIGSIPTPSPTSPRFRCHHPLSPSAAAAAAQDGLCGRLP